MKNTEKSGKYDFKYDLFQDDLVFPEEWGITIKNIGYSQNEPDIKWYDRRDYYILHYIVSGKGIYSLGGNTYRLSKGDGFVYLPDRLISYTTDEKDPWACYWVGVMGPAAKQMVEGCGINAQNPTFHYDQDDQLRQEFERLFRLAVDRSAFPEMMVGSFYRLMGILAGAVRGSESNREKISTFRRLTKYVEFHISYPISVQELSAYCGLSASEVYRIFKKNSGLTPHQYIERAKIVKACKYLAGGDMNITETAHSTGYEYVSHFYKAFKREMGVSPSFYMKQCADNGANARNVSIIE